MKFRNALTLAALAGLMALPFAANAQSQDRHQDKRGDQTSRGSDKADRTNRGDRNQQDNHSSQGQKWGKGSVGDKRNDGPSKSSQNNWKDQDLLRKTNQHVDENRWNPPAPRDNHWGSGGNWYRSDHSDWRDIASTFGFLADLTLLQRDRTVWFDGSAGDDYYPISQYDRDCDSGTSLARDRAEFFGREFFYRDGHRFERRIVMNHGEQCYQFVRIG